VAPSSTRLRRRRLQPRRGGSLSPRPGRGGGGRRSGRDVATPSLLVRRPKFPAARAPGGAAEVRQRRTERCGRRVVVVASLAWGTEDRRPATAWSWPGGGGPRPLGGARQRAGDAVSLGTAVNPFSLSCVTCCTRQRPMLCVAFPYGARQRSLSGKSASCALCRAPRQNPHGKGCVVRVLASIVRP
jgi:hypothetical protein